MAKNHKIAKCPPLRFPQFNDEWKQTTLGEILAFETGYPFPSDSFNGEGNGVRLIKNRDLKTDDRIIYYEGEYDERYIVQNGDILIGMDGDFSPCLWKKGKALLNQRVGRINTNQNASRVFILYVLADSLKEIELKTSSTTVKHLSHKDVEKIKASLPSLAEQEKIASFLSLIDERIQSCSETIKERKREKAALRNQLFSQKLRFPKFSDEWQQTMLGEIAEIKKGSPLSKVDLIHSGYNLAIHYGELFTQYKEKITQVISRTNLLGFTSLEGDILMPSSDVTPRGLATASCIFLNGVILGGDMNIIRSITNQAVPMFLTYALIFQKDNIISKVSGTTVKHIYPKDLYSLEFYLPSLSEQEKIADFLSLIDECIEVEEELLEQYERQKRYLLKQMFI